MVGVTRLVRLNRALAGLRKGDRITRHTAHGRRQSAKDYCVAGPSARRDHLIGGSSDHSTAGTAEADGLADKIDGDGEWADGEEVISRNAQVQDPIDGVPEGMIKESPSPSEKEEEEKGVEESNRYPPIESRVQPKAWSPGAAIKPGVTAIPASPVDTLEAETATNSPTNDADGVYTVEDGEGNTADTVSSSSQHQDTVHDMPEDDVLHGQKRYFHSILDDVTDSRGRGMGQRDRRDGQTDSVFDTTAENSVRDSERAIQFLTTSLDVMFFLVETMVKTAGPIIMDGGSVAADRAAEALFTPVVSPKNFIRVKNRKEPSPDSAEDKKVPVKSWKLLSKFKKQS